MNEKLRMEIVDGIEVPFQQKEPLESVPLNESWQLAEKYAALKEAVLSVLECGECNLDHGYICPMCARGLQALKGGE